MTTEPSDTAVPEETEDRARKYIRRSREEVARLAEGYSPSAYEEWEREQPPATPEENESLRTIQRMSMNLRRQTVFILFGFNMATFNPMQAYQQGVHAVVNPSEMFLLIQLVQKAVADNDMFLHTLRDAQKRVA